MERTKQTSPAVPVTLFPVGEHPIHGRPYEDTPGLSFEPHIKQEPEELTNEDLSTKNTLSESPSTNQGFQGESYQVQRLLECSTYPF